MRKISNEIKAKRQQMSSLERQMAESMSDTHSKTDKLDLSPVHDLLTVFSCFFYLVMFKLIVLLIYVCSFVDSLSTCGSIK